MLEIEQPLNSVQNRSKYRWYRDECAGGSERTIEILSEHKHQQSFDHQDFCYCYSIFFAIHIYLINHRCYPIIIGSNAIQVSSVEMYFPASDGLIFRGSVAIIVQIKVINLCLSLSRMDFAKLHNLYQNEVHPASDLHLEITYIDDWNPCDMLLLLW